MVRKLNRYRRRKPDVQLIDKIPGIRDLFHPTDWRNRRQFGSDSPRYGDTIFIDPREVQGILVPRSKNLSGTVVANFPPTAAHYIISIREHGKISCCLEKWEKGIDWCDTEYLRGQLARENYRYGRTPEEQNRNWAKYDKLLARIQSEGRLRPRKEIYPGNFREANGVLVHIGKDGVLYQGDSGNRRFAASLFAGLSEIPAKVGCVHVDSLDVFRRLRASRNLRN